MNAHGPVSGMYRHTYLITVEDQNLPSEQTAECLHRLSLPGPSWSVGVSPETHEHTLCEGEVALVREGSVDQFGGIPLVLEGVLKLSTLHGDVTLGPAQIEPSKQQQMK